MIETIVNKNWYDTLWSSYDEILKSGETRYSLIYSDRSYNYLIVQRLHSLSVYRQPYLQTMEKKRINVLEY